MTKTEKEKKEVKNGSKDEKTLMTWAAGFIFLVLALVVSGMDSISLSTLGGLSLGLMGIAVMIHALKKWMKEKELKKYDTGMLARIELEN